jgi:hypothetical protein
VFFFVEEISKSYIAAFFQAQVARCFLGCMKVFSGQYSAHMPAWFDSKLID